jgi:tetratricopeptide (TPR) repeat protein
LKGRQHVGDALFGLGRVARAEGNLDQARSCLEECLEIRRAAGQRRATVPVYEELARVAERAGQPTAAVRCWASAAALRDTLEPDVAAAGPPPADDRLAALRNALGDAAFEAAWEEGWSGASDQ